MVRDDSRRVYFPTPPVLELRESYLDLEELNMFMKQTKVWLILTIALSLLALASACSKTPEGTSENAAPAANAKKFAGITG